MAIQTGKGRHRVDGALVTMQRLALENARLTAVCAQNEDLAARHALLLREGDHRIKNSLQVVASLLGLQARRARDAETRVALHAAATRVKTVASIHDALQLNNVGNDAVDLGALIGAMCGSLQEVLGDSGKIKIVAHTAKIDAPLNLAQPIMLAVNELVINAIRHGFLAKRSGAVTVSVVESNGELRISVADDGDGLPENYAAGRGYGMRLVGAMIAKVNGNLDVQNSNGARFTLTAPLGATDAASQERARLASALRDNRSVKPDQFHC